MSAPNPHSTDSTSLTLLQRVRQQDAAAWERLVQTYTPLIQVWCKRCGLSVEDTQDVVQDVLASVAKSIETFQKDREGSTFRGWLRVITRNQIRMHFRKRANQQIASGGSEAQLRIQEIPDEALDEPSDQVGSEQAELYQLALDLIRSEFEERTWQAFLQVTVQGRSAPDVAVDLQMTPGAVRQAKYKVLRRLRAEFGDLLD